MKHDIAIIGGGPAGMIAASRAGELGASVILLEKNSSLGRKLLVTGKARCNITHKVENPREFITALGSPGKFLFSALNQFGPDEVISFFNSRGVKTKVKRGKRVFPVSDRSQDVLDALIEYMKEMNVKVQTKAEVKKLVVKDKKIQKIVLTTGEEIVADKYIICTGGCSYPAIGSTGDGYKWLEKLGHTVTDLAPALTSVITKGSLPKKLEGLSLKNVEISVYQGKKKVDSRFGEALFTAEGLSGPIVIDMSKQIGQLLPGKVELRIDFKPALDFIKLDKRLQREFQQAKNKQFKNCLGSLLPQKLIPVIIKLAGIDPEKQVNLVTKEERKKLLHLINAFTLEVKSLAGFDRAIVTSGGVKLSEVDPKTMRSKVIENLWLAGEVLDLDGPTGGYNLQICWSTGFCAGGSSTRPMDEGN